MIGETEQTAVPNCKINGYSANLKIFGLQKAWEPPQNFGCCNKEGVKMPSNLPITGIIIIFAVKSIIHPNN